MNESQVRKIVRQEIKKYDERQSTDITKDIKKVISKGVSDAALKTKNDLYR